MLVVKLPARIGDLLACLALLALGLACFARLAAEPGGLIVDDARPSLDHMMPLDMRGVGNDVTFLFLPHYQAITRQIDKSGRLPCWDDSGFAGRPMVGNPQGGLFYPPVWVAWWFRAPSALGWLTFAHVLGGGLGAYVLARGFGLGRLGAVVAGGCFEASPYLLAHVFEGHYPHVWAVCWYPWACWAFNAHRNGLRLGTLALSPVLALVFLTGHPQEWYYLALALSGWAAVDALRAARRLGIGAAVVKLAAWGALLGLSLGLAAIEVMPGKAAQAWMLRGAKLTVAQATRYDPHSVNFLQLLSPFALGGPADYIGDDNYWEQLLSIGLVPLVLVVVAAWRHPNRPLVHGLLALTLTALTFALGRRLGLFLVCFKLLPGMNLFRTPSRALFVVQVGAAVLAGLGVEALRARPGSRAPVPWDLFRRQYLGIAAVVLGILCLAQAAYWRTDPFEATPPAVKNEFEEGDPVRKSRRAVSPKPPANGPRHRAYQPPKLEPDVAVMAASRILHQGAFWVAFAGSVVLVAVAGRAPKAQRWAAWGLGVLAFVELGAYGCALLRVSPAGHFLEDDPVSRALARAEGSVPHPFRVRVADSLYDDLHASSHGYEKININDWFQLQHSADLYQVLYPLFDRLPPAPPAGTMDQMLREFGQDVRRGVLDHLNVGLLVSDHVAPDEPWPIVAEGRWKGKPFAVRRNPSVAPRAYVVPRAHPTAAIVSRELSMLRAIDAREAVLMDRDPLGRVGRRQSFRPAEYILRDSDHVVVRVTTDAPGLLVVADTWMPGWTARLDGEPIPILRGNHAQRVIPLAKAGRHEVTMTYQPPGLFLGVAMTIFSALVWAAALVVTVRSRIRARTEPAHRLLHFRALPAPHYWRKSALRTEDCVTVR
ncbi:MAG: hypothetical protein P4L84_04645 [Isosphaeraceae bacterium]|nr:hypothetical protein [Isosphaeraceae bacterium]